MPVEDEFRRFALMDDLEAVRYRDFEGFDQRAM
jgi:hypothetical protein